ncbi:MAG: hypothetical protein VB050_08140 [Geobacteraceae bacterium]|nr:hypothetical protein [Geobacteraceae bacterium]
MTAKKLSNFDDSEYLSDIADNVMHGHDSERQELLAQLLPTFTPEQRALYNKLDDLAIHELVDVQSQTVKALKDSLLNAPTTGAC